MSWQGVQQGRSSPIVAKGKESLSRADGERMPCPLWAVGRGGQLSENKVWKGHPKSPLGTKPVILSEQRQQRGLASG